MSADVVCHGVPAPEAFQAWLSVLEFAKGKRVVRYEHRPKNLGWGHIERVTWEDGSLEQNTRWTNTWRRYFYDDRSLRSSCYCCPYAKTARESDVTMADFWGIESTGLEQPDDQLGVSLILANSAEGLGIVSRLNVRLAQVSLEAALPRNPMLEKPTSSKNDRADVWEGLYLDGMLEMMRKKRFLLSPAMQVAVKVKSKIRSLLGK